MWFNFLVLLTALTISGVAAYYSIIGLTAIFAAAFWPIVVMGGVLEAGKIVTSVWLKKYWSQASWQLKSYLTFAVAILMLVTSIGIFGFLSKAHLDQTVPTGDVAAKVALLDERIKTERDNIDASRKALLQMDAQVDQRLTRSTDDKGAERAVQIRRQQAKERAALQSDIAKAQKVIASLNEERAPIASELRKVEAEVGPIKYVAALIYSDNPDVNMLERAVRWVIIILVLVFDPLAIALLLAANSSIRWVREEKTNDKELKVENVVPPAEPVLPSNEDAETISRLKDEIKSLEEELSNKSQEVQSLADYISDDISDQLKNKDIEHGIVLEEKQKEILALNNKIRELTNRVEELEKSQFTFADLATSYPSSSAFGPKFPTSPTKGDIFVRIDSVPSRVYKFNGDKWIEVDKNTSDTYSFNQEYINYLVEQLKSGKLELDQLSQSEQDQIKNLLSKEVVLGK